MAQVQSWGIGLLLLVLMAGQCSAHPGIGIVRDGHGNVYYSDLKQVWRITPDGKKSVVVPNVHTHELWADDKGNLYGEHLRYFEAKWRHRVWRMGANLVVEDVINERDGMRREYSFVRDAKGNMYWIDLSPTPVVCVTTPAGRTNRLVEKGLQNTNWLSVSPQGDVYLVDSGDLKHVAPDGRIRTLAKELSSLPTPPVNVRDRHYHMGIWLDSQGSLYVALPEERAVVKVTGDGSVSVTARSEAGWHPSGGLVDEHGTLWLLEYNDRNEVRVRSRGRDDQGFKTY